MNKIIPYPLVILIFFVFEYLGAQDYNYENTLKPVNDALFNTDCYFKDSLEGWIVGNYGKAVHTKDGGKTWERHKVEDFDLKSVAYDPHTNQWWATCEEGLILKFDEKQNRWIKIEAAFTETNLWGIRFSQANKIGVIVSGGGIILRYDYDADSWVGSEKFFDNNIFNLQFGENTNQTLICGSKGLLSISNDKSLSHWRSVLPQPLFRQFASESFYSCVIVGNQVWAGSTKGNIVSENLVTNKFAVQKAGNSSITGLWFDSNGRTGFAINTIGEIYRTINSGITWKLQQKTKSETYLNSIRFLADKKKGFICGQYNSLLTTINGGGSWNETNPYSSYHEAATAPNGNILIASSVGMAAIAPEGEEPKIVSPKSFESDLFGICIDENKVWLCGENSTIVSSRTDGSQWKTIYDQTDGAKLYSVYFNEKEDFGIAVGDKATVLIKSKDANKWKKTEIESKTQGLLPFNKVSCARNRCWILGDKGRLYISEDFGKTWIKYTHIPSDRDLNSITFNANGKIGYISTTSKKDESQILKSTDSGANWSKDTSLEYIDNITRVLFGHDSTIFLSSTAGDIFKSENAGRTWFKSLPSFTDENLCGLAIDGNNVLHAVGHNGIHIKTSEVNTRPIISKFEIVPTRNGYRAIVKIVDDDSDSDNFTVKIRTIGGLVEGADKTYRSISVSYSGLDSLKEWPKTIFKTNSRNTFKLSVSDGWNIVEKDITIFVGESAFTKIQHFMHWDEIPRTFDELKDLVAVNSVLLVAVYCIIILTLYVFAPIQIFHLSEFLHTSKIPYGDRLAPWLIFFLGDQEKVLVAFVSRYAHRAIQSFEKVTDVSSRPYWIPAPFEVNGRPHYTFAPLTDNLYYVPGLVELQAHLSNERIIISIEGQGGIGKSSLAYQIGRWASETNPKKRLFKNISIPIFLNNLSGSLDESCRLRLEYITNRQHLSNDFVNKLLRAKLIIPIVDGVSEMSDFKLDYIDPELGGKNTYLMVITSRKTIGLPSTCRVIPIGLKLDFLDTLLDGFITHYVGAFHFAHERETLRTRIKSIIVDMRSKENETTVPLLLLRLSVKKAERLIDEHKPLEDHFPTSFSMLIDDYLEDIFRNEPELEILLRDLRLAACTSIGLKDEFDSKFVVDNNISFRPAWTPENWYLVNIPRTRKDKFLISGVMIDSGSRDDRMLKFSYDPIAEYLAAKEIVIKYRDRHMSEENFEKLAQIIKKCNVPMHDLLISMSNKINTSFMKA